MVSVADSDPEGKPCRRARIGAGQGAIWGEALAGPAVAALATIGPISSKRSGRADPRPAPSSRRRSRRSCPSPLCAIRGPESACREARAVQCLARMLSGRHQFADRGCQTGAVGSALAEDEDRVGRVAHHARNLRHVRHHRDGTCLDIRNEQPTHHSSRTLPGRVRLYTVRQFGLLSAVSAPFVCPPKDVGLQRLARGRDGYRPATSTTS